MRSKRGRFGALILAFAFLATLVLFVGGGTAIAQEPSPSPSPTSGDDECPDDDDDDDDDVEGDQLPTPLPTGSDDDGDDDCPEGEGDEDDDCPGNSDGQGNDDDDDDDDCPGEGDDGDDEDDECPGNSDGQGNAGDEENDDESDGDGESTSDDALSAQQSDDDDDDDDDDCPGQDDGSDREGGEGQEKISLCHATGSATNPYVFITVASPAATKGGHANHEGDIIPASGPEDCPYGEAILACISTFGVGSEDANPVFCRGKDVQANLPFQYDVTFANGESTAGVGQANADGEARFDFEAPTGDFEVTVRALGAGGEVLYQQTAAGVAGVSFGDDEAAPAPAGEDDAEGAAPAGAVAAGYGGTAPQSRAGLYLATGILLVVTALALGRTVPAVIRHRRDR